MRIHKIPSGSWLTNLDLYKNVIDLLPIEFLEQFQRKDIIKNDLYADVRSIGSIGIAKPIILKFGIRDRRIFTEDNCYTINSLRILRYSHAPVSMLADEWAENGRIVDQLSQISNEIPFNVKIAPHNVLDTFCDIGGLRFGILEA